MEKKRDYGLNPWVRLGVWLSLLVLLFGYALHARQLAANTEATRAEATHPTLSVVRAWAAPKDQPIDSVKRAIEGPWQLIEIRQPTTMDGIGHATFQCRHDHPSGAYHEIVVLFGRDTPYWSAGTGTQLGLGDGTTSFELEPKAGCPLGSYYLRAVNPQSD